MLNPINAHFGASLLFRLATQHQKTLFEAIKVILRLRLGSRGLL